MEAIEKRQTNLKRQTHVLDVESACLEIEVGSKKTFEMMDIQAIYMLKGRLHRMKLKTGMVYGMDINGNNVIVTRKNNEQNDSLPNDPR